jgi:hypothetical protein
VVLITLIACSRQENKPEPGQQRQAKYQTLVDPKPHDCDFDSTPVGDKYCAYETVTDAEYEECGKPQCGLKDVHVGWRKVEMGTLDGRVFAMSEIGTFYPAMKAKGYLISCEPPPPQVFSIRYGAALRETPTDACEYSRTVGLERYKSMPDCESFDAQFAFQKVFRWASNYGVRTVPFRRQLHARPDSPSVSPHSAFYRHLDVSLHATALIRLNPF